MALYRLSPPVYTISILPVLSTAQCLLVIVRQLSEKVEVVNKSHQAFTNVDAKYGEIPK